MVSQGAKTVVSLKKKGYRIFVDGKCVVGARTSPLLRLFNPPVVFISIWQSFKTCSRAAQSALEGRMRPAGRSLPTPRLDSISNFSLSSLYHLILCLHVFCQTGLSQRVDRLALPAVFPIKTDVSRSVPYPKTGVHFPAFSPNFPFHAERQAEKL